MAGGSGGAAEASRVVVVAGGLSYERDVSLRSGRRVADALTDGGVEVVVADADAALLPLLADGGFDAAFIALHGGPGEDGAVRDVLACAAVPYVGSTGHASRVAHDKPTAKQLLARAGVATPEWVTVPHATFRELGAGAVLGSIVARLGLPLMVKPAQGGSALGASVVTDAADLPAAMVACFSYGSAALVEQFVDGTEVAVSVLADDDGPRVLPAVEIAPVDGRYDYNARYTAGATRFHAPARLAEKAATAVADAALTAHTTLGLRDLSRTDLIVDAAGTAWFLEVNVSPGLTETSLLPMAVHADGLDLTTVYRGLVDAAVRRGPEPLA